MKYYVQFLTLAFLGELTHCSIFDITSSLINSATNNIIKYYCDKFECCTDKEIPYKLVDLEYIFHKQIYGQHIAVDIILNAIISHVQNSKPKKPLVMSFHGSNGNGKTYISRLIAQTLYKKGDDSKFFHFYYGLQNFPLKEKLSQYQEELKNDINNAIHKCKVSLFIFDGIDHMPPGLLDVLMPFIDCPNCGKMKEEKNKSIFLFLTNAGSLAIQKSLLNKLSAGIKRESTTLQDFEHLIISEIFNHSGGLFESLMIKADAIDYYVPFLPLEKKHVKYCIQDAIEELKTTATQDLIEKVIRELRFGPEPDDLFSTSGCKRVSQITSRIVTSLNFNFDIFDGLDSVKSEL